MIAAVFTYWLAPVAMWPVMGHAVKLPYRIVTEMSLVFGAGDADVTLTVVVTRRIAALKIDFSITPAPSE